jgi:pantoate--beta-alanine ligase
LIIVARSLSEIRHLTADLRSNGQRIAFVPTMGALHDGHLSLVRTGLGHADVCVASIFVNPTQFAANEDFSTYPRNEQRDLDLLASAGCTIAYCPTLEDMYPPGDSTRVIVRDLSWQLEGEIRPHFFEGVATVVSRLFNHVQPDVAVFGEKDYQQLQVIKRMVRDLAMTVQVIGAPTIREADGLAMSSRNAYLSEHDRSLSGAMYAALKEAAEGAARGESIASLEALVSNELIAGGFKSVDYVAIRHGDTLAAFESDQVPAGIPARILAAARMGKTRLIDNLPVVRG